MTSNSTNNGPSRKSFAQVAAEANVSNAPKIKITNTIHQNTTPGTKMTTHHVDSPVSNGVSQHTTARAGTAATPTTEHISAGWEHVPNLERFTGVAIQDNRIAQPLLFDKLEKMDTSDTKSVTSRTTLALDEKDSLQPDDSASMQAAPDQDTLSPRGSVIAESRVESDLDAGAFHDQLKEIDHNVPVELSGGIATISGAEHGLTQNGVSLLFTDPTSHTLSVGVSADPISSRRPPPDWHNPPDEKLLEALESPKDRLFVLKIEQDIIDFVRDSSEEYLQLPQTNSFYRMLSHKLADYYLLGHLIDESMTSVRIFRTPYCRLPPSLLGQNSPAIGATPALTLPARKIMRRGARHGSGMQFGDEEFSSKATSESGHASGSDEPKDKAALTREERENRYKEARARIFKDFKEQPADVAEVVVSSSDLDPSRTSSTSEARKSNNVNSNNSNSGNHNNNNNNNKKNKKTKDDGFEARSAYSQYGTRSFSSSTGLSQPLSPDSSFYDNFGRMNVTVPYLGQHSPLTGGYMSQQAVDIPHQEFHGGQPATWQSQFNSPGPNNNSFASAVYSANGLNAMPANNSYGSNTAFQATPKASHLSLASYGQTVSPQNVLYWSQQPSFHAPYAGQPYYHQESQAMQPGNFGSNLQSHHDFNNANWQDPMHFPLPSYSAAVNRAQFNPRSQAFVPQDPSFSPSDSRFAPHHQSLPLQSQVPNYASPNHMPQMRSGGHTSSAQQQQGPPKVSQQQNQSSIHKWAKPSTLPPKPPPPASTLNFQVLRSSENIQPLPPNPLTGQRSNWS